MSKYKDGEHIFLIWDCEDSEYEVIKGHVTQEQAQITMNQETGNSFPVKKVEHKYGRWSFPDERALSDGYDRMLSVYDESNRGRFKITLCYPVVEVQYEQN